VKRLDLTGYILRSVLPQARADALKRGS